MATVLKGNYSADSTDPYLPAASSLLTAVQTVSTLPAAAAGGRIKSTIAEMRLHPGGGFLYVGNRGHDSIAVFRVGEADGLLERVAVQKSHGAFPRHFNFDNTGRFLLVGNHASDSVAAFRYRSRRETLGS